MSLISLRTPLGRFRWRFSRLGLKLFLIILSVNVAISTGAFLAVSYSIDRGFLEYLNQAQERRATLLADSLVTRWQPRQSWAWLERSPERWPMVVRHALGQEHRDRPSPLGEAQDFVLRDADERFVIPPTMPVRATGTGSRYAAMTKRSANWGFARPNKSWSAWKTASWNVSSAI